MNTLLVLALIVAASVVIARPTGPVTTTASQEEQPQAPVRKYLKDYVLPRFLWDHYFSFHEIPKGLQEPRMMMPATEWLSQEIQRLSQMQLVFKPQIPPPMKRWPNFHKMRNHVQPYYINQKWPQNLVSEEAVAKQERATNKVNKGPIAEALSGKNDKKKTFALTPRDEGYFEPTNAEKSSNNLTSENLTLGEGQAAPHETEPASHPELEPEPPRHTRQNPNLSRHSHQKSLVAEDLDELRRGFVAGKEDIKDNAQHISMVDKDSNDSSSSFYGVALLSAIGAAAVLAILGFAIGWYTLSKRAKAAADVDYPAYGVTGPTIDSSGDRKLAHSAHMYHYQHQKQQIIAMERNGMEQRSGSISDPESDDENEEGDYTVYECPGFATTGDMEVKNPLFNEDPTPATPGKRELVKQQPKD